jgi:hypothetical protein
VRTIAPHSAAFSLPHLKPGLPPARARGGGKLAKEALAEHRRVVAGHLPQGEIERERKRERERERGEKGGAR